MKSPDSVTLPFLVWLLVIMPALGIRAWFRLRSGKPLPPKRTRYLRVIALELLILGMTSIVARRGGFTLFVTTLPPGWAWLVAAAYLAIIGFRVSWGWKRLSPARSKRARLTLPECPAEMRYWIPISLLAGIAEEYAYRGAAFSALSEMSGSFVVALAICVLSFGVVHAFQGWRGVLGAMLLAILFHITVVLTLGLYLAIAFHAAYDLMIGIIAMRAFRRDAVQAAPVAQNG